MKPTFIDFLATGDLTDEEVRVMIAVASEPREKKEGTNLGMVAVLVGAGIHDVIATVRRLVAARFLTQTYTGRLLVNARRFADYDGELREIFGKQ